MEEFALSSWLWSVDEDVFRAVTLWEEFNIGLLDCSAVGKENQTNNVYKFTCMCRLLLTDISTL